MILKTGVGHVVAWSCRFRDKASTRATTWWPPWGRNTRIAELSGHLPPQLKKADWATRRELIGAVVQRIDIGPKNIGIVLRLPAEPSVRGVEPILVTLSRA